MEKSHLKPFTMLPPKPGVCQECAIDHSPESPHNKDSLFYQYYFFNIHGRWPTWKDAMKHCDEETKTKWSAELIKRGVILD